MTPEEYRREARAYLDHDCPYCHACRGEWCRRVRIRRVRRYTILRHVHAARLALVTDDGGNTPEVRT